jgi:hypothetical protein
MQNKARAIVVGFLVLVIQISSLATLTHAQDETFDQSYLPIDGIVSNLVCLSIGGNIVINQVTYTQEMELCKYGDRYFRIATGNDCLPIDVTGQARDPDTREEITFGWYCEVPRTCDEDYVWQVSTDRLLEDRYFETKFLVENDSNNTTKSFEIVTGSRGSVCTQESFDQLEKKISIYAKGIRGNTNSMNVTIPTELLSGDLKVMMWGEDVEYERKELNDNATMLSFNLEFGENEVNQVDIIGTEVIPEFGTVALIVMVGTVAGVIVWTRFTGRSSIRY